jgi:hypothetical protein
MLSQLAAERATQGQRELRAGGDQMLELTDHRSTTHRADDLAVADGVQPTRSPDVRAPGRFARVKQPFVRLDPDRF